MVWNTNGVSSIVESFYSADNAKKTQNQTAKSSASFSDILTAMYQNYQTGLLTGGSSSMMGYTGYPVYEQSNYLLQNSLMGLLADKISQQITGQQSSNQQTKEVLAEDKPKTDWVKMRVIHRYQQQSAPAKKASQGSILI